MPSGSRGYGNGPAGHRLSIVGIGPGSPELRTFAAKEAIVAADFVVGYRPYLELIGDLLPGKKAFSSGMGREVDRVRMALDLLEEGSVALVSSGDPNVYGMAGLGLEMAERPSEVKIVPAITAFTAASCRAGLFFRQSVCAISLSDLLTPWPEIEARLRLAAEMNLPIALYNPKSRRREWQLLKALEICGRREALLAKDIGRQGEETVFTSSERLMEEEQLRESINMTTLVILLGQGTFRGPVSRKAAINLVGIGPGRASNLTQEARSILAGSEKVFGAERYLRSIEGVTAAQKVSHDGPWPERMAARYQEASEVADRGGQAVILTGGDPTIFSAGWRILDQATCPVHLSPGVSAFSCVAARAGAPLVGDFALLSSGGDPAMASLLANSGFAVVVYNLKGEEVAPILERVSPGLPVALARDVDRAGGSVMILTAGDLLAARPSGFRFTLILASRSSYIRDGRIITRRGYENKYSY
ncbi:MAG TPA: SAM-dependent methyltransferase [Methanothrix sp.]|nr:SAM-dependent methyltransferase [Methanothrix sp.]